MEGVEVKEWRDRRVFITGGTGLLGSWMVKDLLQRGADVVCLVRDWIPESELVRSGNLARCKIVRGELADQEILERTINEYEAEIVFHLGAQTIVGAANRNPTSTFASNITGTWTLLEASRRSTGVQAIVVASSDKAYGAQPVLPYTEEAPLHGRHPYDASKAAADLLAQSYAHTYGLNVAITRCGNLYGGGDLNWNRIVPGTIRSLVRGERPVVRSDGRFVRDYFYVEDAVLSYVALAEAVAADKTLRGEAFNFSTERPTTVLEIVDRVKRLMGSNMEVVVLDQASNEIREQYLSAEKARRRLGWKSSFTLDEGLERTIAWYRTLLEAER